ncbi:MAG: hypothetical protein KDI68_04345 [Gammaproteobacteria bacterium]|nr:hypothetical protein [Gammaproteobacteria bacterium]
MNSHPTKPTRSEKLKSGPVIFQADEELSEEHREKKDLTLAELNHLFKMYLKERGSRKSDIAIIGQFSLIFNDPDFARWHQLSKPQQSDSLSRQVIMPPVYEALIKPIGAAAGDESVIKSVTKDALQNAIDSFSHAAYLQKKYISRYPGVKIILYLDQAREQVVLTVVDNGFGEKIVKPKKNYVGEEYGSDFASRLVDWVIRRFFEKEEGEINRNVAYTGGQGMAMKKLRLELGLNIELHFLATGAVFELELRSYF